MKRKQLRLPAIKEDELGEIGVRPRILAVKFLPGKGGGRNGAEAKDLPSSL